MSTVFGLACNGQLTNSTGTVTLAKSYDPYGTVTHTNGAAQSAYGFTGEMADVSGLTYLRARYYSPLDGRFIAKDPSRLERNLYLYASANPVNFTDPTGLYSSKTITKNIPLLEFEHPEYPAINGHDRGRWGFFMMLREAKDFNFFYLGQLKLDQPYPSINYGDTNLIWSNCEDIFVNFQPLSVFYENEVKRQRQPKIFWRDTSATHYHLNTNSIEGIKTFIDGAYTFDLPYYHGISVAGNVFGQNIEANIIVDINGSFHLSLSTGKGLTLGAAYTESYLCGAWGDCDAPSPEDITDAINGICLQGGIVNAGIINGGVNVSPICYGSGSWSSASTFYTGIEAGFTIIGGTWTFSLPITIPSMGWIGALHDRLNGIYLSDVKFVD